MTLAALIVGCVLVVAMAAIVALRMRQSHELALLAAKPVPVVDTSEIEVNVADLQERVKTLEVEAVGRATKRRRA